MSIVMQRTLEGVAVDTASGVKAGVVLIQRLGNPDQCLCIHESTVRSLDREEVQYLGGLTVGPMRLALRKELIKMRANGVENGRVDFQAKQPIPPRRTPIPASSRARAPKYAGRVELAQENMTQLISDMATAIEDGDVSDVTSARFAQRYSQMREEITAMRAAVDALEGSWELVQSQMIRLMG
jgi:hypothetical protein